MGEATTPAPSVHLLAIPSFHTPPGVPWETTEGATDAELVTEFAGRASFRTFDRPNPLTADNASFMRHILEIGSADFLAHATVTVYIAGISCTACNDVTSCGRLTVTATTAHRSQNRPAEGVVPAAIADDEQLSRLVRESFRDMQFVYDELVAAVEESLSEEPNPLIRAQRARQVARVVLPDGTTSSVVVTGSVRDWRDFIAQRGRAHSDPEIRTIAVECLREIAPVAPVLFDDLHIVAAPDGGEMVEAPPS